MLAAYLASCYFLSHITVLPYLQLTLSLHDALPICAMDMALKDASLEPEEISYINAHGTSTDMNDRLETKAIKEVFGDQDRKSTRLNSSHVAISYAVFCLKKKKKIKYDPSAIRNTAT